MWVPVRRLKCRKGQVPCQMNVVGLLTWKRKENVRALGMSGGEGMGKGEGRVTKTM